MKGSKAVRTHLSTQKVQNLFEKSAKERKASKNLYTLNKQSDDEESNETNQFDRNLQPERGNKKSRNRSYQHESSPSQSDEEARNQKNEGRTRYKQKIKEQSYQNQKSSSESQSEDNNQNDQVEEEQRIQKYLPSKQHDKQNLKLHMNIKQLQQQNELLNNSLLAHENRQKDMIGKFAKLQAQNRRFQYEIVRITKSEKQRRVEEELIKRTKNQIETIKKENQQILGFIESQNMRIISYIKALIGNLVTEKVPQTQSSKAQNQSIAQYLQKCISTLKQNRKTIFKKFPFVNENSKQNLSDNIQHIHPQQPNQSTNIYFSYQTQRILHLNEQNSKLNSQIKRIKEQFTKLSESYKKSAAQKDNHFKQKDSQFNQKLNQFKLQKTQLCDKYNQAIEQLKAKYKILQQKIQQQQQNYHLKLKDLENTLAQKEKVIKKLKQQLRQMNVKLQEIQEERFELHSSTLRERQRQVPYKSKKKFIDGDFLNQSLNSNKQKAFSKDYSLYREDQSHENFFYEYQPQKRKRKNHLNHLNQDTDTLMRKSHKHKKITPQQPSLSEEEFDLLKIDRQIQKLQRQVLRQFENSQ